MAIKKLIILLPFVVLARGGFSRFDCETGSLVSPFAPLITLNSPPPITAEIAFTNLYGFSPMESETRFVQTDWGIMGGSGIHRWSALVHHFDALGIWREISPSLNYGVAPTNRLRMEFGTDLSFLTVPDTFDIEFAVRAGVGFHTQKITVGSIYEVSHLSDEPDRSIPLGEFSLIAVLDESRVGSQGVKIRWNHTDREGSIAVTESFSPVEWCRLGVGLSSYPVELGFFLILGNRSTQSGVFFSRHPLLGWSQTGAVSHSFGTNKKMDSSDELPTVEIQEE